MKIHIIILTVVIISCSSVQKSTLPYLTVKETQWQSIIGQYDKDSSRVLCLLGMGFFRDTRSDYSDSLLSDWIQTHPNAEVKYISTIVSMNMTYCWLVDNGVNLNIYLVKNGCFPGGTMIRPPTWDEMTCEQKEIYGGIDKPNILVHIDKEEYDEFLKIIEDAELYAIENKLGIWKDKE